jgi:hypothetical protein
MPVWRYDILTGLWERIAAMPSWNPEQQDAAGDEVLASPRQTTVARASQTALKRHGSISAAEDKAEDAVSAKQAPATAAGSIPAPRHGHIAASLHAPVIAVPVPRALDAFYLWLASPAAKPTWYTAPRPAVYSKRHGYRQVGGGGAKGKAGGDAGNVIKIDTSNIDLAKTGLGVPAAASTVSPVPNGETVDPWASLFIPRRLEDARTARQRAADAAAAAEGRPLFPI